MTKPTKKKGTAKKPPDKGERVAAQSACDEALREEIQRADDAWGHHWEVDTLDIDDLCAAVDRFRASFDDALATVDRFVTETNQVSERLREIECELLADGYVWKAGLWADVTSPVFQKAAAGIVGLVEKALISGYPDHVLKAEKSLLELGRAEWGRMCAAQREMLVMDDDTSDWTAEEVDDFQCRMAAELITALAQIDERSAGLNPRDVAGHANRGKLGDAGFAAVVACVCGAFGYKPSDEEVAQRAFKKAMGKGITRRPL